ncbi:MAG TPA: tetratricopeptide repeat protein [Longimicrobiaceae bacterium]|nr:tetratricopeptide repeat protein [Longimicrobiaceae bacterium]
MTAGSAAGEVGEPRAAGVPEGVHEQVDALNASAWRLRSVDPERAAEMARDACAMAHGASYVPGEAYARRTLGVTLYTRSEFDAALAELERALELFERTGYGVGRAGVLNGIGNVHWRRGNHPESLRLHLSALQLQRAGGDREGEAASLNFVGNVHCHLGGYARALEYYRASLAIREEIGDTPGVAYCLNNIGNIHGLIGEPAQALDYHLRALQLKEEAGDRQSVGVSLVNVATAYDRLGDHGRALEYFARALEELQGKGLRDAEADALRELGFAHERGGELRRALEFYSKSLEITREIGARYVQVETLVRIGVVRARLGETEEGLASLREAVATAEEIGSRRLVYEAHQALAEVWEGLGECGRALEHQRAFHAAWEEVFNQQSDARIRSIQVQAEVEHAQREAELYRQLHEELLRAYTGLREADREKARLVEQLRVQTAELERQTREDALTGLSNRRDLDERMEVEFERSRRFGRDLSVAMADLDRFKEINDRFSHAVGDEVLRRLGRIFRGGCRGVDAVGRYGGEEFVLVLVESSTEEAAAACERVREAVERYDWTSVYPELSVTLSIGVCGDPALGSYTELLACADARLYEAKRSGRNRVCW